MRKKILIEATIVSSDKEVINNPIEFIELDIEGGTIISYKITHKINSNKN